MLNKFALSMNRWVLRVAVLVLMLPTVARAESIAIVVGIGHYETLSGADLPGIDNDVKQMTTVLQKAGFRTVRLFNEEATEEGIEKAFAEARDKVGAQDRFVYYHSGHGSEDFRLILYNTDRAGHHMLSNSRVKDLMASIPTNKKSLLLDACFSGGFKSLHSRGGERTKFYSVPSLENTQPVKSLDQPEQYHDRNDNVRRVNRQTRPQVATGDACAVFASSQPTEPSLVIAFDDRFGSVFTHYLARYLDQAQTHAWNEIVQPTIQRVQVETQGRQTPVFDDRYLAALAYNTLEVADNANGGTHISNFLDLYEVRNVDTTHLKLTAKHTPAPNQKGEYHPDTDVDLTISVGAPGYLFLINLDDKDNAQMIGWDTEDLDFSSVDKTLAQCHIEVGRTVRLKDNGIVITTAKRQGQERWKAFLFTDRDKATEFASIWLALLNKKKSVPRDNFERGKIEQSKRLTNLSLADLYTSEVHYGVTTN